MSKAEISQKPEAKSQKPVTTESGIEVKPVYTAPVTERENPGEFPFTRGLSSGGYRGKLWTMRQYAGFSSAEESNKRYHYLLQSGTTGLSVAFDLPTQMGYDSDHELAEGEVGKAGVAIDTLRDMEILFDGIRLDSITTSMTINATASILLAMYITIAKKQGCDVKNISGTIQNDILKEYAARGTYIYPPKPSMRIITDIFEYCSKEVPKWNTISISGYHIREAGATAAQELAFTLSNGKAYVKAALEKGLDINVFGKRLSFFFNAHNNLFQEVAKFRAGRKMWAEIMKDFGATDERAQMLRFHTQTGGSTLTAQQPMNNIVRVTLQALSAVLGGTQSLHTNGYDEALGLPSEEAARVAVRTQQIIAHESGAPDTTDPLGGSYYIESLTDELEKKAKEIISKIDKMGGSVSAIEQGYIQKEIANSSYRHQQQVENKEKIIVGVNDFTSEEKNQRQVFTVDESAGGMQKEKIKKIKQERDAQKVSSALKEIETCAKENRNLMPAIINAVESYATLGEISQAMKNVFGEHR
jgi:methylmalonyl-CoA mutase N-terminal domain/subunit